MCNERMGVQEGGATGTEVRWLCSIMKALTSGETVDRPSVSCLHSRGTRGNDIGAVRLRTSLGREFGHGMETMFLGSWDRVDGGACVVDGDFAKLTGLRVKERISGWVSARYINSIYFSFEP
jgi:hypothetical protein